uniref:Methyltranfer_dom domain-containing protein n=1 Tax=Panagrellus redivivus TaxID=6233 RepID=A0A7E4ZSL5_PANRE
MRLSRCSVSRASTLINQRQRAAAPAATPEPEYNRTFENGQAHVTAINPATDEHGILKLTPLKNFVAKKTPRHYPLPPEAVDGLKQALVDCLRAPKVLQHEADQITEKLSQRRFPASSKEVQAARKTIVEQLKSKGESDAFLGPEYFSQKVNQAQDRYLQREVSKKLKKTRYNWKPLEFDSREEAAAFTLSRLPAYYAEVRRVLAEFSRVDFAPKSVLDYGSGTGSVFWAVRDTWSDSVEEYCLVDTSDAISQFAMDVMRGKGDQTGLIEKNVYFRRALVPSPQKKYDLTIIHRGLIEIGSHEKRLELISTLWQRTNRFLVIIESELEDSFEAVIQARNFILTNGVKMDSRKVREELAEHNLLDETTEAILHDRQMSYSEKYALIRERFPDPAALPTFIETGYVFAPCPHDQGCPKIDLPQGKKSCKFSARWNELRADGRTKSKRNDGTGTSMFSYTIMEKGMRPADTVSPSRVLDVKKASGCVTCTTCTPFDGLLRFPVSRRAGPLYKLAKTCAPGSLFPIDGEMVASTSEYHVVREMLKEELGKSRKR